MVGEPSISQNALARAIKTVSLVLRSVQRDATQAHIAAAAGINESTLSRLLSTHLEHFALVLAHAGLKVVPAENICVKPETYRAMTHIARCALADQTTADRLIFEDDE